MNSFVGVLDVYPIMWTGSGSFDAGALVKVYFLDHPAVWRLKNGRDLASPRP
jgi:hypothetical protein